jgi:anti-sigma-K factor RskA
VQEEHVIDLIPGYALGILSEEEQRRVQLHLSQCSDCQAELEAYQSVVNQLAFAAPQYPPPTGLKQAILRQVETQSRPQPVPDRQNWFETLRHRLASWLPASPAWTAVTLVLILVLAGSNLMLWLQVRSVRQQQQQNEYRMVNLQATQSAPGSSGLLIISPGGGFGALIVDGLPDLPKSHQYQLWLIKDGKRTSGGVFSTIQGGYGVLQVNSAEPLIHYQSFGITIEPSGGSSHPTGNKVLGGNL